MLCGVAKHILKYKMLHSSPRVILQPSKSPEWPPLYNDHVPLSNPLLATAGQLYYRTTPEQSNQLLNEIHF